MKTSAIQDDIELLPTEAQQEVVDFVAFLRQKHGIVPGKRKGTSPLGKHPFVGMWKGRRDMADSCAWVRKLGERKQEVA